MLSKLRVVVIAGVLLGAFTAAALATTDCPVPVMTWGMPGSGSGQFQQPFGLDVGPDGYVYVADQHNERIQVFTDTGTPILSWPTPPGTGGYAYPTGVHVHGTTVWVSANQGQYVGRWTTGGAFLGYTMSPPGGWAYPTGITTDELGNAYVCDSEWNRIVKFDAVGNYVTSWYTAYGPYGIDYANGKLYVGTYYSSTVQIFKPDGTPDGGFGFPGGGPGEFYAAEGITHDAAGNIFVCDTGNDRIQKFTPTGTFLCMFGVNGTDLGQLDAPSDIDIDGSGGIYVAEFVNSRVHKWTFGAVPTARSSWGAIKSRYR